MEPSSSIINFPAKASLSNVNLLSRHDRIVEDLQNTRSSTIDLIPGESSGSNVMEPPADIQNKPDTFPKEERQIQEVKQRCWKLSERIKIFEEDFDELKNMFPEDGLQFQKHISGWKLVAGNLYARKVNQLNNSPHPVHGRKCPWPNVTGDEIFRRYANDYFSSFECAAQAGFNINRKKEVDNEARLLMARWTNLMLDFFLDMKELEILPPTSSEEYPSEDASQFVVMYALGRTPSCDVATNYLYLDLRASILGDWNKKLKGLAQ
ncbi:hypothetical protein PCANC_22853, partial [Puccinia coronata f. sp. avenae]